MPRSSSGLRMLASELSIVAEPPSRVKPRSLTSSFAWIIGIGSVFTLLTF